MLDSWPAVSPWVTLLLHLPTGEPICSTMTQIAPLGPPDYSLSFAIGQGRTHFYLYLNDGRPDPAESLHLIGPNGEIAAMQVIGRQKVINKTMLVADMASDDFVKVIVPHLLAGEQVSVRATSGTFPVPDGDFKAVFGQIQECVAELRETLGG